MHKLETRVGLFVLASLAIFVYMGFKVGTFHLSHNNYASYTLFFDSIAGLSCKSEVKIAGVKVGWVEDINLVPNCSHAQVTILMEKKYSLYANAQSVVRQEGFLGPKYVEIIPGDPALHALPVGQALQKSEPQISMDALMQQFKMIAQNVCDITESFKQATATIESAGHIKDLVQNITHTSEKLSCVAESIDKIFHRNEDHIENALSVGTNVNRVVDQVEHDVLPLCTEQLQKISDQTCDGLHFVQSIAQKIDNGDGCIGKLVNDDDIYRDIKIAADGFRTYVNKLERLEIVFDSHFESMFRRAENFEFEDAKGYFDIRVHPSEDYFYLIQIVTSEHGFVKRSERDFSYCDPITGKPVDPNLLDLNDEARLRFVLSRKKEVFKRNSFRIGFQFGKIFHQQVALRFGLIEGSGGVGIDIDIPFNTDYFRWVTTFEAFDFRGWNRKDDRRPHLKWLNRMFILRNIYINFGADDFVSKHNASVFFGAGVRFGDNDVKYVASLVGGAGLGACAVD